MKEDSQYHHKAIVREEKKFSLLQNSMKKENLPAESTFKGRHATEH